jgi:hypothetical protein
MGSELLDPIGFPNDWDYFTIGGVKSPGKAVVTEFKRRHEFDVKKSKGVYGATITFVGRPPATGKIRLEFWQTSHFVSWAGFRPLLKYNPTKSVVTAVDIFHPSLDDIEINRVVCESVGNIVHEGNKLYVVDIELLEYFPPPPITAVSTPTTSLPDTDPNKPGIPPDPVGDANDKQIGQLMQQAQQP